MANTKPFKSYMICTTPRSGSTLLCKMLAATGVAGVPDSHFHTPSLERWAEVHVATPGAKRSELDTLNAVFDAARTKGTGDSDIFGLRMQGSSFPYFRTQLKRLHPDTKSDKDRLRAAFGPMLFIHLTRANKLDQAISRTIAEQSGLWHRAADGTGIERRHAHKEPVFNRDHIQRNLVELTALEDAWHNWFQSEGIQPYRITYDELADAPLETLERLLEALGLDASNARAIEPPTQRLATPLNAAWAQKFQTEPPDPS